MSTDTSCINCGACCKKGGPALHTKDSYLFEENILSIQDVVTIRAGELVRDDMKNRLVPLPGELVKIAPAKNARPDDWTCRFLTGNNRCFLHGKHPAECRAFYCKEPEALMQLSNEPRLEREKICELIKAPAYWIELIKTHEEAVKYEELGPWALTALPVNSSWKKRRLPKKLCLSFLGARFCRPWLCSGWRQDPAQMVLTL